MQATIEDLLGQTLTSVTGEVGGDEIKFETDSGTKYLMNHYQDCCEDVCVEDICGDLSDLVGSPIIIAEERTMEQENPDGSPAGEYDESFTWTFYELATIKGSVTIRWYGSSNGYYSESVDFEISP